MQINILAKNSTHEKQPEPNNDKMNSMRPFQKKYGPTYYGFPTLTITRVSGKGVHNRLETQTFILNQNFTPLIFIKSESQISSMSTLLLSTNGTLNYGKFILNNHGEIFFCNSVNKAFMDKAAILKVIEFFEKIAQKALEFHLPRILFAANFLTLNEFLRVISKAESENVRVKRLRDENVFILTELHSRAYLIRENINQYNSSIEILDAKQGTRLLESVSTEADDETSDPSAGENDNVSKMSLLSLREKGILAPKFKELLNMLERFVLKPRRGTQDADASVKSAELLKYIKLHEKDVSDMQFGGVERGTQKEIEPDRRISSRFILKSQTGSASEYFIMRANRLCSLSVVHGQFEFFDKNQKIKPRTSNLLHAKIVEEADQGMIEPLHKYLSYFYKAETSESYHGNILPHYERVNEKKELACKGEFYCEFHKHGTVENFIYSKRDNPKFVLAMLRGIVNSQLFLANRHKMIHTDVSLYNVYITRGMQPKVGFLNKVYVIGKEMLPKLDFKEKTLEEHWKKQVDPSNLALSALEVLRKQDITERCVVFMVGTLIMQYIFGCKPKIKMKTHEPQIYEKQMKGIFSLNFMPVDVSYKGPVEILEPLYIFTKACIDNDINKRPRLQDLGLFLHYVYKSLDYTFV